MANTPSCFSPSSTWSVQEMFHSLEIYNAAKSKLYSDLFAQLESLIQKQTEMRTQLDALVEKLLGLNQKDFPLDVRFEREYYKDFPVTTTPEHPDFQEKFLSLVNGLDADSVETVVLALQRLNLIQNSIEPVMVLYSAEEKRAMRQLIEHFFSNILKLSNDCWYYRGYSLPVYKFEVGVFVNKLMIPKLKHPERFADKDIIDAGAYIGDSACILSPLTSQKVYAFEPAPDNYSRMLKTLEMNKLDKVIPYNCALGESRGKVSFSLFDSASSLFENKAVTYQGHVEVELVKLDDFVQEHGLQVGLIKADIEGAESSMLRGAVETLKAQRPTLLISIYHTADDFFGIKPWIESLNLGYTFKICHSIGTVMTETILIAEVQ